MWCLRAPGALLRTVLPSEGVRSPLRITGRAPGRRALQQQQQREPRRSLPEQLRCGQPVSARALCAMATSAGAYGSELDAACKAVRLAAVLCTVRHHCYPLNKGAPGNRACMQATRRQDGWPGSNVCYHPRVRC